eukprot:9804219-Karenia_brevis.AAC.1
MPPVHGKPLALLSHLVGDGSASSKTTKDPIVAMQWVKHMLDQASTIHKPEDVAETLCDREITGSSAFSGIETPIVAD